MRTMRLGSSDLEVPVVAVGCMRMNVLEPRRAARFVAAALEEGANFFDHADIYGGGASERVFAAALDAAGVGRDEVLLQSKCGIREGYYDSSREHILASVDGILRRLRTDHLDVLLLHRPDALTEPEEVAEAFDRLERDGKVLCFGVSNHNSRQIELLRRAVRQPLVANQLQLSLAHTAMIDSGLNVNKTVDGAVDRDGHVLDYCRLQNITVQPWSPFQADSFDGVFLGDPRFPDLNAEIDAAAQRHGVSATTIALAWLLRHPAGMQPVVGTMNPDRLRDCCRAAEVRLSRQEWYALHRAAGNALP